MIYWDSIKGKVAEAINTPSKRQEITRKVDGYMLGTESISADGATQFNIKPLNETAEMFISTMKDEISRLEISRLAAKAISNIKSQKPYVLSTSNSSPRKYVITIYFDGKLERDSLFSEYTNKDGITKEGYPDGVDNIVALLNAGYSARRSVYGVWNKNGRGGSKGERIPSLKERPGTFFIQSSVKSFEEGHKGECGILEIRINPKYEGKG